MVAETGGVTVLELREEHHGAPLIKTLQDGQDAEQTQKGEGEPALRAEYKCFINSFLPAASFGVAVPIASRHLSPFLGAGQATVLTGPASFERAS